MSQEGRKDTAGETEIYSYILLDSVYSSIYCNFSDELKNIFNRKLTSLVYALDNLFGNIYLIVNREKFIGINLDCVDDFCVFLIDLNPVHKEMFNFLSKRLGKMLINSQEFADNEKAMFFKNESRKIYQEAYEEKQRQLNSLGIKIDIWDFCKFEEDVDPKFYNDESAPHYYWRPKHVEIVVE